MKYPAKNMPVAFMQYTTYSAKQYVEDTLKRADEVKNDVRRAERVKAGKCPSCFYLRHGRIGCAAMTTQPCMCCGKDQVYGSTATDVLCLECAKEHDLCKQCGGDREMRVKRRNWPKSAEPEVKDADQRDDGNFFILPKRK